MRWASERGLRLLDWGLSDLRPARADCIQAQWGPAKERRIVTLRSPSQDANNHRDPGHLLNELTRLLTDDEVPDHITTQAGSLLYRYFA